VVPALGERYVLSCAVEGEAAGAHVGQDFVIRPGQRAAVFSPGESGVIWIGSGHRAHNVMFARSVLEQHLTTLTGACARGPLRFEVAVDLGHGPGAAVLGLAELLQVESERPSPSHALLAGLRDALLTTLLTGLNHSASNRLAAPTPSVTPACVRRAEEYLAANVGEAITLQDLVAAVGVPARSLQVAFKKYRSTTPMAFLRQLRLESARRRLLDAHVEYTVVDVARELGLGNPGRFAVEYKRRFGESPSQTLARARRA
jgi:AraC-like DNA-binding protein